MPKYRNLEIYSVAVTFYKKLVISSLTPAYNMYNSKSSLCSLTDKFFANFSQKSKAKTSTNIINKNSIQTIRWLYQLREVNRSLLRFNSFEHPQLLSNIFELSAAYVCFHFNLITETPKRRFALYCQANNNVYIK